jgi:hypothetical protein
MSVLLVLASSPASLAQDEDPSDASEGGPHGDEPSAEPSEKPGPLGTSVPPTTAPDRALEQPTAPAQSGPYDPIEAFAVADALFQQGRHGEVAVLLLPLLEDRGLLESLIEDERLSRDSWHRTELILAQSLYYTGRGEAATEHFKVALRLSPNFVFVPAITPAEVIGFYTGVRAQYQDELAGYPSSLYSTLYPGRVPPTRLGREIGLRLLGPFGGALMNQQRKKGITLFVFAGVTAASSFATWLALLQMEINGTDLSPTDWRILQVSNAVLGGAFWIIYVAGVIDAEIVFLRQQNRIARAGLSLRWRGTPRVEIAF